MDSREIENPALHVVIRMTRLSEFNESSCKFILLLVDLDPPPALVVFFCNHEPAPAYNSPLTTATSALRILLPAAPIMVLWLSATNLMSKTGSSLILPTVTA